MVMQSTVKLENFDPLAKVVKGKLRWSPFRFAMFVFSLNVVLDFGGALATHALLTKSGHPGLLQDASALFVDFVQMPLISGYYIWSLQATKKLLEDFDESEVFVDKRSYRANVDFVSRIAQAKWVFGVAVIIAMTLTILWLGAFLNWFPPLMGDGWLYNSRVLPWLRVPMWFVVTYGLIFGLYNVGITIFALRRFFRNQTIHLAPWHPDKCGGLSSISRYSISLSYAIAIVGMMASILTISAIRTHTWGNARLLWLGDMVYLILAPSLFFLPLGTAHTAMKSAKSELLSFLAKRIEAQYEELIKAEDIDGTVLAGKINRLEQLNKVYKITEEFPIWPFDVSSLRRFFAVTGAPVVPALFSLLIDIMKAFFLHLK